MRKHMYTQDQMMRKDLRERMNRENQPRVVSRATFDLLKVGPAPRVILSKQDVWEVSVLPRTVIVPKDSLEILKQNMKLAAVEDAYDKAHEKGRALPGIIGRIVLALDKWEIGRFIKEAARGRQE